MNFIKESWKKYHGLLKNIKLNNGFQHCFNKCFLSNKFRMISEGSRDTEDWSNDAENSALITEINCILKYIQIESS